MKRVAESQLTKDAGENDDDSQEVDTEFKKADPSVLGTRRIKSLPRRGPVAIASPAAPSPPMVPPINGSPAQSPEASSRFGAFTGFGGGAPSAFTFTPPASQSAPPDRESKASSPSSFNPPVSAVPKPPTSTALSNPTPPSTPPLAHVAQGKQDAALKYCTSLRGLNSSFLDATTKAVKADPFVDIAELLEKYRSHRLSVQKEFDNKISASDSRIVPPSLPPQVSSSKPPLPSMPVPPKSFFSFGATSGSTAFPGGGFTPKTDSPPGAPTLPFSFGTEKTSTPTIGKPSSGGFASAFRKPDSAAPFGTSEKSDTAESEATTVFTIGNNDKPSEKAPLLNFKFSAPVTPGFSSFMSPKTADTSTPPPKLDLPSTSPPSPSVFGFGAAKNTASSSPFGSFGKGSIGNPVGFAFGSPTATPNIVEPSNHVEAPTQSSAEKGSGADPTPDGTLSAAPDASHDPSPAPSQGSAYDADGPGEEDEATLYETRARAYKLTLTGEKKSWVSVGSGQLKLKVHVDLVKRRLLMRNSSTGHVILNFNLFPGFQVTTDKKDISFRVPGESEAAAVYRVRVPGETEAVKWQETIEKEVEGLVTFDDT